MLNVLYLAVLNALECESNTLDNVLCDNIEVWEYKLSQGDTDKLTKAVLQAVLYVAKELACQQAVFLPVVSQVFLHAYKPTHTNESSNAVLPKCCRGYNKVLFTVATESVHCAPTTAHEL